MKPSSLKKRICALLCAVFLFAASSCTGKNDKKISDSGFYLDTVVSITLYGTENKNIIQDCFDICGKYEKLLSAKLPSSEIYRLNAREINTVSDETAQLITKGLYYSALSDGAFDITVGTLTELWDFKSDSPEVPPQEKIDWALPHVGYEKVSIEGNTVSFADPYTKIDLGAIAKGYIADKIKEFLLEKRVEAAVINLGGNVLCVGEKPDGSDFNIGLQYPFKAQNEIIATVSVKDISVVSSGTYQRYFYKNDVLYHHILNTETGYPVNNSLSSVTIFSTHSVDGDALSTVCFALGLEKGMEFIDSLDGVYAVFIDTEFNISRSEGLENICNFKQ